MKINPRLISGALALTLVSTLTSQAWDTQGHMMVAGVAYKKLTKQTKNRVDTLLVLNPDRDNWLKLIPHGTSATKRKMMIFMVAATWPDRIKSDHDYHTDGSHNGNRPPNDPSASQNIGYDDMARHKYWHFIDKPFSQDNTELPPIIEPNAKTQIKAFREVLASATKPDKLKSYDLSWLLHLVGDVHQPLHCTARITATDHDGDDGGNGVKLNEVPGNLHSFWDDVLGDSEAPSIALGALADLPDAPASAAADLDVDHWIDESFNAAKQTVYRAPIGAGAGPFTLTQPYEDDARELAEQRVALAGARLAKILNEELK